MAGLVAKSCLTLATPWTVACQAPLSLGFSRQEHWSGLPCPPPGDLPNSGIEPGSPALQADSLPSEPPGKPSVQFSSVVWSCLTLCDPMDCSTPALSITNSWNLFKLMSIESVIPSKHLILCHPLLPSSIFSSIRVFSREKMGRFNKY